MYANLNKYVILNNLTSVNYADYEATHWYKVELKVTSFAGKTWQVAFDGGAFSGNYTFFNNTAASDVDNFYTDSANNVGNANTFYIDDIGSGTTCPVAGPSIEFHDSTWFQILWNNLIKLSVFL